MLFLLMGQHTCIREQLTCCGSIINDGAKMSETLLLWDVDGTLVNTGRAGELALARALEDWGLPPVPDVVEIAGRTDRAIVRSLLQYYQQPSDDLAVAVFCTMYLRHLPKCVQERRGIGYLYPGVKDLLQTADALGWTQGLVTGNLRDGAKTKLSAYGIWSHFAFGAFADDSEDRNDLPQIAAQRALSHGLSRLDPSRTWIIGDTPRDVTCAKYSGFRCLAVATGSYSVQALQNAGADVVLENLSDTAQVLLALG